MIQQLDLPRWRLTQRACIITVPADWHSAALTALAPLRPNEAFDARRLAQVFGAAVDRVVGPAWQGHVDADGFAEVDLRGTRLLRAVDRADLTALATACDAQEWEASTVDLDRPPVFGYWADGRLVAAGTLTPWGDRFWHVGIVHPPWLPRTRLRADGGRRNDPLRP
jgi:hypothetical protein